MLCFASGTDREQERVTLPWQSAGGALAGEARTARTTRDVRPSGGESARVPTGKLLRSEGRVALFSADFAFMLEGLTFDMSGLRRRRRLGPE